MAALTQDPKSKMYRILFWFSGKQYHKSLKTSEEKAANAKKGSIEELLQVMEKGLIAVPSPDKFWPFLFSGGKLDAKPSLPDVLSLDRLFTRFEQEMSPGTMEANTLATHRLHKKHLLRIPSFAWLVWCCGWFGANTRPIYGRCERIQPGSRGWSQILRLRYRA